MALGLTPQQIIDSGKHPLLVIANNWERILLNDLAEIQNGYAFSSKFFNHEEGLPLIRIRDIRRAKTENLYSGTYNESFIVNQGDILIGMDGDFNASKWPGKKGLLNQRVCRVLFHSKYYLKEFLFLCLKPYLEAIHSETSAVTVKHLSSNTIKNIPLPLPPLPEQRAIVAKIEELFSSLDQGVADLKKAQDQLKVYRQAVLKKAFEGELTKKWREENRTEWVKDLLGNILKVSSGKGLTAKNMSGTGYPVYGGNGINGYHSEYNFNEEKLIIGRVGVKCGVTHITKQKSWVTDNALVVRFNKPEEYNLEFMKLKLQFENLNKLSSSTAQPVVSGVKIYAYEIEIPPIEEQHQIVREIESRLSVCDKVEESITESLEKAKALRQSILKKAFEGQLLSEAELEKCKQAKDYEPASELLKRIKKEKK